MRRAAGWLAVGAVFVLLGGAARPQAATQKSELEGTWKAVAAVLNGKALKKDRKDRYLVFAGDTVRGLDGERAVGRGTFEADPAKAPHSLDVTITDGPPAVKGLKLYGIYEVKGETLKLCFTSLGADERPREFASPEDAGFLLLTLVRDRK